MLKKHSKSILLLISPTRHMPRCVIFYCILVLAYLLPAISAAPLQDFNPCFESRESEGCLIFIINERKVSYKQALVLIQRAVQLFKSEDISGQYYYLNVAVACLASEGTLLPSPDGDCAACSPACKAEARPEVCELYCSTGDLLYARDSNL